MVFYLNKICLLNTSITKITHQTVSKPRTSFTTPLHTNIGQLKYVSSIAPNDHSRSHHSIEPQILRIASYEGKLNQPNTPNNLGYHTSRYDSISSTIEDHNKNDGDNYFISKQKHTEPRSKSALPIRMANNYVSRSKTSHQKRRYKLRSNYQNKRESNTNKYKLSSSNLYKKNKKKHKSKKKKRNMNKNRYDIGKFVKYKLILLTYRQPISSY